MIHLAKDRSGAADIHDKGALGCTNSWEVQDSLSEYQLRKGLFHGSRHFAQQTVAHSWDMLSVCFGLVSGCPQSEPLSVTRHFPMAMHILKHYHLFH
jgi:hypothetical protein